MKMKFMDKFMLMRQNLFFKVARLDIEHVRSTENWRSLVSNNESCRKTLNHQLIGTECMNIIG